MQHVQISDLHILYYCSYQRLLLCTFIMLCLLINVNKNDLGNMHYNTRAHKTKARFLKFLQLLQTSTCMVRNV